MRVIKPLFYESDKLPPIQAEASPTFTARFHPASDNKEGDKYHSTSRDCEEGSSEGFNELRKKRAETDRRYRKRLAERIKLAEQLGVPFVKGKRGRPPRMLSLNDKVA